MGHPLADRKSRLWVKGAHNYVGLGSALFLLVLLGTGIALNHPLRWIPGAERQRLSLAADPSQPQRLYRGGWSSLERSDDRGATWEEVPMAFPAMEVVDIAFHPRNPNVICVLQRWQGPLVSRDGGVVWERVPLPFDPQDSNVELIAVTLSAAGELFLDTSAGLLKRPAQGVNWQPLDFDPKRKNWSRLVKALHNGHFFGEWFVKVYDAAAVALLFLIVSGVILWRIKQS